MEITRQPAGDYGTYIVINPRPPRPSPSASDISVAVVFFIVITVWLLKLRRK